MNKIIASLALVPLLFAAGCSSLTPQKVQQGATALTKAASGHAEYLPYLTASRNAICLVAGSTNVTPASISNSVQNAGGPNPPPAAVAITDGILALLTLVYVSFDVPPASGKFGEYVMAACNGMTAGLSTSSAVNSVPSHSDWHLIRIP